MLFYNNVQAQKWAPLGTKWSYEYYGDKYPYPSKVDVWAINDTVTINGHLCSCTGTAADTGLGTMFTNMVTYEDSSKVYWHIPGTAKFTILYDFTKNAGESWEMKGLINPHTNKEYTCPFIITVVSTGIDTINGIPLKSMIIKSSTNSREAFNGKVIQYIGSLVRPRPTSSIICFNVSDYDDYLGLRCVENSYIGFYDFHIAPSCDYVTDIKELHKDNIVQCTPNPSSNSFDLVWSVKSSEAVHFSVTDVTGRIIHQVNLLPAQTSYHIDASQWQSGMYIYNIELGGVSQKGKLIKQ